MSDDSDKIKISTLLRKKSKNLYKEILENHDSFSKGEKGMNGKIGDKANDVWSLWKQNGKGSTLDSYKQFVLDNYQKEYTELDETTGEDKKAFIEYLKSRRLKQYNELSNCLYLDFNSGDAIVNIDREEAHYITKALSPSTITLNINWEKLVNIDYAFYGMDGLTVFDNLTSMTNLQSAEHAFDGCVNLTSETCQNICDALPTVNDGETHNLGLLGVQNWTEEMTNQAGLKGWNPVL